MAGSPNKVSSKVPQSLLAQPEVKRSTKIKIYFKDESQLHKISIDAEDLTTYDVINHAIVALSPLSAGKLSPDPSQY